MPFVFQVYFSVILMASKRKMEDDIMTKENFAEELRNRLPEYMPDRYKNLTFSEKKTNKNNGPVFWLTTAADAHQQFTSTKCMITSVINLTLRRLSAILQKPSSM